jgi:hypothetical protein
MNRLTQDHSKLLHLGQYLLAICLCLAVCALARAAGYPDELDAPAMNAIGQHTTSEAPVIICGRQPGQRPASLNIRGADVATLWRSAYLMLFPGSSLTTDSKVDRAVKIPHKGPAWSISISHDSALVTVQTKW